MSSLKTKILIDIGKYNHLVEKSNNSAKPDSDNLIGEGVTKEEENLKNDLKYQQEIQQASEGLITPPNLPLKNDLPVSQSHKPLITASIPETTENNDKEECWDVGALSDEQIKKLTEKVIKRYTQKAYKLIKNFPEGVLYCGTKYQLHLPTSKDRDLRTIFKKIYSRSKHESEGLGVKYVLNLIEKNNLNRFLPPTNSALKNTTEIITDLAKTSKPKDDNTNDIWYFIGE